ncbi:MAG: hypothetical protein QXU32_02415 [Nitrososphaerales archaeon]
MTAWKRYPGYNKYRNIEYEEGRKYSNWELEQLADQILRTHAKSVDPQTGKRRGIGGKDPVLFAEHLFQRQRREILNVNGIPEPELVQGMYYRSHPEGRKVNSPEDRKRHRYGYYR